jgi:hypothetical protein
MKVITKTVRELFEAIQVNGLEQIRGNWLNTDSKGNIVAGCLLTQGAFNLKVVPTTEVVNSDAIVDDDFYWEEDDRTVFKQLNRLPVNPESPYSKYPSYDRLGHPFREDILTHWGTGDAIISWYDAIDPTLTKYLLPTYEDALNMARSLLEPYFDKELKLLSSDQVSFINPNDE